MNYSAEISGHTLEFIDHSHTYVVDGVIVPSITEMLKVRFGNKYQFVDALTLKRASDEGTAVHETIERYLKDGEESDIPELRGFKFLAKRYEYEVLECETPVILSQFGKPISAGRLDLVLKLDGKIGGADIKRTSTLDKEYLAYQLNLYRIAYRQCYGIEWEFLRGVHLRGNTRKFVPIPINETMAWELVKEYMEAKNE